jgi:penicillin amidase
MRKALIVCISLLVIVGILAAGGAWFVRRPWPRVDGTLSLPGLTARVEVIRDDLGVPQIYAQNEHDLFFAQGYVHAQDRLWQMEFNRRIGSGTLSAALGSATLETDRFLRTMGLRRAAEKDWALMGDETKALMQAYADGVNAFIETHQGLGELPLEFTLLGVEPASWTPLDTLAWGKVMAYDLGGNYGMELFRARLIAEFGEEMAGQLVPPYPADGPVIIPPEARSYAWLRGLPAGGANPLASILGEPRNGFGSNNWVVHGSRTATGKPLLADDTHLGLDMPSIWYENGLHGGRFDVVGYSFPGAPMVIIGHNQTVAWGVTNLGPDVQDLYIEQVDDPIHPSRYRFEGEWLDIATVQEVIEVKGEEPVMLEVYETHHGPIMNAVLDLPATAAPLALRWTALDGTYLFRAVEGLDLASNWEEFRQALSYWDVPSQNFVYADVTGNIGYQSPGKIPIRAEGHQGVVPVPGWTGEYEWQGYIPFEELPSVYNPATGFVATANNKVVPDDYPYHLGSDWAAPQRAQRITDLLAADDSITIEDMQRIHGQTYSLPAEALLPRLLAAVGVPENDLEEAALGALREWDLYMEADRPGATIYEVWYYFLIQNTLRDELGEEFMEDYIGLDDTHIPAMIDWAGRAEVAWFDDTTTAWFETREDIMRRSFTDALQWLSQVLGDDPSEWEWGRLHTKTFVHNPIGQSGIALLENLFNSDTFPARGGTMTVDAAWYSSEEFLAMGGGVSQRMVVNLADLDSSLFIHTTGQSAHLFHPHREDMIELWQEVEYGQLPFSRAAVDEEAETVLVLEPQ